MNPLPACPFCGCEKLKQYKKTTKAFAVAHLVKCTGCKVEVRRHVWRQRVKIEVPEIKVVHEVALCYKDVA